MAKLPQNISVVLSDISEGMLRDVRRRIGNDSRFAFQAFDCHRIPFASDSFDLVIANHVLFYCKDISKVCREVSRVLIPGGTFLCSTYGASHMQESRHSSRNLTAVSSYPVMPCMQGLGLKTAQNSLHRIFQKFQHSSMTMPYMSQMRHR